MEFSVPRLPSIPPHLLFFLIVTAYCASLVPCSVCLDAQYEICRSSSTCGNITLRYPFGAGKRGCGLPSFQIDCVQNSTAVIAINALNYAILKFHYGIYNNFVIAREENCQFLDDHFPIGSNDRFFNITSNVNWTLTVYNCKRVFAHQIYYTGKGQLRKCNATVFYSLQDYGYSLPGCSMEQIPLQVGIAKWIYNDTKRDQSCKSCIASQGICGYNTSDSAAPFLCYCRDGPRTHKCPGHGRANKSAIIIGCFFGGVAVTAIAVLLLTFYVKRRRTQFSHSSASEVEKFLREYAYEKPTRYSSSQLKKITNNFAEKLGEGGYGVVYKGKFRNDTLVAVKLLDRQRHSEAQFINEVATIGHVHHVNLVRLLGYCFESVTSALVYEYMVNGSLEKFIFAGKDEKGQVLKWAQLFSIALGAARGIAYLHQDCNKRIIHFDIKPHNILLDADFTPKVADFGLAKLCGKGEDHVSMTGGRGTPGYVAPEVCDTDAGPVTEKSDVYSFGMLLLEIVGGRKNINWKVSRSSQFYFPEWAFKLLERGELRMRLRRGEMESEDEEKSRKLTKVGLWCIQYDYRDRPSMGSVVQMLEGIGDDVANPPLPFNIFTAAPEIPAAPEVPLLSRTGKSSLSIDM